MLKINKMVSLLHFPQIYGFYMVYIFASKEMKHKVGIFKNSISSEKKIW